MDYPLVSWFSQVIVIDLQLIERIVIMDAHMRFKVVKDVEFSISHPLSV
jgi:hypothetical protein